jgi:hypothetical protein
LVVCAIEPLFPVAADLHEAGFAQECEVLRNARVAEPQLVDDLTDRQFLVPDETQDLLASRLRDQLQRVDLIILANDEMCGTFALLLK